MEEKRVRVTVRGGLRRMERSYQVLGEDVFMRSATCSGSLRRCSVICVSHGL